MAQSYYHAKTVDCQEFLLYFATFIFTNKKANSHIVLTAFLQNNETLYCLIFYKEIKTKTCLFKERSHLWMTQLYYHIKTNDCQDFLA